MTTTQQDLFGVLAEPRRRQILDLLLRGELSAGAVVRNMEDVTQPTVSKHLTTLRRAGLVTVRSEAQHRMYDLDPEPLVTLDNWLVPYRERWAGRLDALGKYLDNMSDERLD